MSSSNFENKPAVKRVVLREAHHRPLTADLFFSFNDDIYVILIVIYSTDHNYINGS